MPFFDSVAAFQLKYFEKQDICKGLFYFLQHSGNYNQEYSYISWLFNSKTAFSEFAIPLMLLASKLFSILTNKMYIRDAMVLNKIVNCVQYVSVSLILHKDEEKIFLHRRNNIYHHKWKHFKHECKSPPVHHPATTPPSCHRSFLFVCATWWKNNFGINVWLSFPFTEKTYQNRDLKSKVHFEPWYLLHP